MRIVFLGTPLFAKEILEGLMPHHDILAVITQPDKPFGRKKILKAPEVKEYAIAYNITCFQPEKSIEIAPILHDIHKQKHIDAIVVVAYGKILAKEVVSQYICLNLHGSLLPNYRGASPVQTSIMNDYKHFGLSVIRMDEGLDSGEIAALKPIESQIVMRKKLTEVFHALVPYGISLLQEVLTNIAHNTLHTTPQNHAEATYCPKLNKKDCYIDFIDSYQCYLRYLALEHIGIWTFYKGMILKINTISDYINDKIYEQVGIILAIDKSSFCISCKIGALWIESVTPQNKSKMAATSFLQSQGLKVGDILLLQ